MQIMWVVAGLLLAADRLTKLWAENVLKTQGVRAAWPGVFQFAYARNTGMAFSMLTGNNLMLALFNVAMITLVLIVYFRGKSLGPFVRAGLVLIAMGGLSNVIDRLAYGYVIDFIDLMFMDFAVFNLADVMVTSGVLLAAAGLLIPGKGGGA